MPNAARQKGDRAERRLVESLLSVGVPAFRRGYQTRGTEGDAQDRGDVWSPGVCWQVKDWTVAEPHGIPLGKLIGVMRETVAQALAAGDLLPVIVEKRRGYADALDWWCHLRRVDFLKVHSNPDPFMQVEHDVLVRARLRDLVPELIVWVEQHEGVASSGSEC